MESELKGLPGLGVIRKALGLVAPDVADATGVHREYVYRIENGGCDCSLKLQRRIAAFLCCDPADLLSVPSTQRLAEIEVAWKSRDLEASKKRAAELAGQKPAVGL